MPAPLQAALDVMLLLLTELFTILVGIIFPAAVTPVSALASFAILFPLLAIALGFLYKLVRSAG